MMAATHGATSERRRDAVRAEKAELSPEECDGLTPYQQWRLAEQKIAARNQAAREASAGSR